MSGKTRDMLFLSVSHYIGSIQSDIDFYNFVYNNEADEDIKNSILEHLEYLKKSLNDYKNLRIYLGKLECDY